MKITALTRQTAVTGSVIMFVPIVLAALVVHAFTSGPIAYVLYAVLAVAWIVATVRSVQSINRTWVRIDADTVAWQTWVRPGRTPIGSESGSVPMATVARFAVVKRERTVGRNVVVQRVPVLTLTDGREITLPILS